MRPLLVALILAAAVTGSYGRGGGGGGKGNCTAPMTLLKAEPDTYATLLTLIDAVNATRAYERPQRFNVTRAPTEAFWDAWFAASGTTALPDLSTYNDTQLRQLRRAVIDLMAPLKHFLPRNDTRPPGDDSGPPGGDDSRPPRNGTQPPTDGGNGDDGGDRPPPHGDSSDDGSGEGGRPPRGNQGGRKLLASSRNGGGGGGGGPRPPRCQNVTLSAVDDILEGAGACPLEACLGCSGLEGCACVDCQCQCTAPAA